MQWPLLLSGLAMGLAAMPHCAFMCAAPCAALTRDQGMVAFQGGRLLSYAAIGALSAYSVSTLGAWSQSVPALRPWWTLLHLAFLGLGLWWLLTGQHPAWMRRDATVSLGHAKGGGRLVMVRAGLGGLAWVAWPCAALQAALLLASLGNGPREGALVMTAFALASMPGLLVAPWALRRWQAWRGAKADPQWLASAAFRIGGAGLVITSSWALTRGIWHSLLAWCGVI